MPLQKVGWSVWLGNRSYFELGGAVFLQCCFKLLLFSVLRYDLTIQTPFSFLSILMPLKPSHFVPPTHLLLFLSFFFFSRFSPLPHFCLPGLCRRSLTKGRTAFVSGDPVRATRRQLSPGGDLRSNITSLACLTTLRSTHHPLLLLQNPPFHLCLPTSSSSSSLTNGP